MRSNIFLNSKNTFIDTVSTKNYVHLDAVSLIYQSLKNSVKKPLKLILLYGKPGTGKSMFLTKLYDDLSSIYKIFFYSTPILDENEFYKTLAFDVFGIKKETLNFSQFISIVDASTTEDVPVILLDEAQLYPDTLMEKIRLLADTRKVKFVISLHKTEREDLIAKEHFQTRIWETIELKNSTSAELKIYIQKKLLKANCFDTANMFHDKNINLIYKLTKGNYRNTNKLIYTLFDIYAWYNENNPSKINSNHMSNKIIEMSAIHTGLIHA